MGDNIFLQADSRIVLHDVMDQITGRLLSVAHSLKHEDDKGEVTIKIKLEKTYSGIKIGKELSMKHAPTSGKNIFALINEDTGQMEMEQSIMDFYKMREANRLADDILGPLDPQVDYEPAAEGVQATLPDENLSAEAFPANNLGDDPATGEVDPEGYPETEYGEPQEEAQEEAQPLRAVK